MPTTCEDGSKARAGSGCSGRTADEAGTCVGTLFYEAIPLPVNPKNAIMPDIPHAEICVSSQGSIAPDD